MYEQQKELAKEWLSVMTGEYVGDIWEGFERMMVPNVTWQLMGYSCASGTCKGIPEIKAIFDRFYNGDGPNQGLVSIKVTAKEMVALEDGRVMILASSLGEGRNGLPYRGEYVWLLTIIDGRITEIKEYTDTISIETVVFNKQLVQA